ncbi:MAG: hypothetical protein IJ583_05395 [Firmicutes bacterium]|nr:hypothetical protein [Bacillota bacterium]
MKRKIATFLSVVMVGASFATNAVSAAPVDVTGNSGIAYVDESVINVVVPTTKALDFTVDPQGLVYLAETGKTSAEADELEDYKGRIVGTKALVFANKSIKDVTVTTEFSVTKGDGMLAASGSDLDAATDDDSSKLNLIFMAVPTAEAISLEYADNEEKSDSKALADIDTLDISKDFKASAKAVQFSKTAATVKNVLPAADFSYTYDAEGKAYSYELDKTADVKAAGYVISGFCNPNGNFKNFKANDVTIKASYDFAIATEAESTAAATNEDAFGVLTTGATFVTAPKSVVFGAVEGSGSGNQQTTNPVVAAAADGSITITAPSGKTFDDSTLTFKYKGADANVMLWKNGKPTINSDKTVWTLSSTTLSYAEKTDDSYIFKLKYADSEDVVSVTYKPEA